MIQRYPVAIRLRGIPRNEDGRIKSTAKAQMSEALIRTLIDITLNQQATSCVDPEIQFRLEPNRLLCALLAREAPVDEAARWRNQNFDAIAFRGTTERALARALQAWEREEYRDAFIATTSGLKVMEANKV